MYVPVLDVHGHVSVPQAANSFLVSVLVSNTAMKGLLRYAAASRASSLTVGAATPIKRSLAGGQPPT